MCGGMGVEHVEVWGGACVEVWGWSMCGGCGGVGIRCDLYAQKVLNTLHFLCSYAVKDTQFVVHIHQHG